MSETFKAIDANVNRHSTLTEGATSSRECRYGRMKWLTTDYGVGQHIALYGEYSEGECVIFRRFIKYGDTVISAGGNIGAHLVPLSRIVGMGRVITFEPQSFLLPILRENLAVNGCTNVEVHAKGLGREAGNLALATGDPTLPNNFGGLHFISDDQRSEIKASVCEIVTIDSLNLQRLDFLMLDIEGMEEEALRGAVETIARCRPLLYVEIDKEEKREPLLRFIKDELGYEIMFHLPNVFNPHNYAANPKNHFGEQRSIMCLAVPC
jgi:FkbM family methyltransferase